jgi:hypothetical protein
LAIRKWVMKKMKRNHNSSFFSSLTNGSRKLVLHYTRLKRHASDKHSSLLGPFVSELWKMKHFEYRNHNSSFFSSLTNGSHKLVLHYTRLERIASDKHSSLLGPFVSELWKKWSILNTVFPTLHFLLHLRMGPES